MREPTVHFEFDQEGRVRTEVIDYCGTQELPERPDRLPCDFCNQTVERLWCRHVRPFVANLAPHRDYKFTGGTWNACDRCCQFLMNRNIAGLARRIARAHPEGPPLEWLESLFGVVYRNMEGGNVEWRSGDRFPVERRLT